MEITAINICILNEKPMIISRIKYKKALASSPWWHQSKLNQYEETFKRQFIDTGILHRVIEEDIEQFTLKVDTYFIDEKLWQDLKSEYEKTIGEEYCKHNNIDMQKSIIDVYVDRHL